MTALGTWAMGLCAAGVVCAVCDMLSPSGGLKRVSTMLTALFFFGCLIGPLGEVIGECRSWCSVDAATVSDVDTTLDKKALQQVEAMMTAAVKEDVTQRMALHGLTVKKVTLERDMSYEDSIYIKRIRVVFAKEDAFVQNEAVQELERAFGVPVEVYYTDEQ